MNWVSEKMSLYEIISDYLEMKKVCTRRVPKLLAPPQRANRVDCCEELMENCNQDPTAFFSNIMTEDQTWIYHYHPLSQQEVKTPGRNQAKEHQLEHESHDQLARSP